MNGERHRAEPLVFFCNIFRVHEIEYGFGGPSEKNVSPHYPLANEVAKGYSNATVRLSVTSL